MNRILARAATLALLALCLAVPARPRQLPHDPAAAAQQTQQPPAASAPAQEPPRQPSGPSNKVPAGVRLESQMPAPAAPRPFDFPRPATKVLPNGLEVFVVPRNRQPAVSITLLIPSAGGFYDPA